MAKKRNQPVKRSKIRSKPASEQPAGSVQLPEWFTNRKLHIGLIFAFSILLYVNTFTHDYAVDDAIVITENMFTTQGVEGIGGILKYDTFYGFFKDPEKATLVAGGRYRPLSLVFFAFEVELFGQSPFIGHLVNALLYGLTSILLYWLLLQLFTPVRQDRTYAFFIALCGALLFAAHPLHTEVVANIKGRDEILTLLGSLGALALSLRAYRQEQRLWNIFAGLVFFLALFSKENAITFLAVVPLTYYFFSRAHGGKIFRQTLPFLLAAVIFLLIRGSILGWQLNEPVSEMMNNPFIKVENGRYLPFTAGEKLATITFTMGKYIQLLIFPHPLTHDYYPRQIGVMSWSDWQVLFSFGICLVLGILAVRGIRKKDPVSFGILYFFATISIVSNLFFPVGTHMSERLIYMPSVGYCLVIPVLLFRLSRRLAPNQHLAAFRQLYPALGIAAFLTLFYGFLTVARNPAWADNFTLFSTDVQVSKNSAKLQNAMGGELVTQASKLEEGPERERMLQAAIQHLQRAISIHPNYKNAYLLSGNAHFYLGAWEEAIKYYGQALQLDPGYQEASGNLAIAYRDAGRFYGENQGDLDRAVRYLEQSYQMRPDDYETARLLGVAYGIMGNTTKAVEYFNKAAELNPESADALYNLGSAYYNAGNPEKGQEYHQRAIAIDPEVAERMR